jgi:hypothetical protein
MMSLIRQAGTHIHFNPMALELDIEILAQPLCRMLCTMSQKLQYVCMLTKYIKDDH